FRHLGLEKVRHTVEPEVQYLFVPQVHRQFDEVNLGCTRQPDGMLGGPRCRTLFGAAYLFDERDAINRRNFFSYGVTTRLFGRGATAAEAAAHAAAPEPREAPPVDPEVLPQGLSAESVPPFVR